MMRWTATRGTGPVAPPLAALGWVARVSTTSPRAMPRAYGLQEATARQQAGGGALGGRTSCAAPAAACALAARRSARNVSVSIAGEPSSVACLGSCARDDRRHGGEVAAERARSCGCSRASWSRTRVAWLAAPPHSVSGRRSPDAIAHVADGALGGIAGHACLGYVERSTSLKSGVERGVAASVDEAEARRAAAPRAEAPRARPSIVHRARHRPRRCWLRRLAHPQPD